MRACKTFVPLVAQNLASANIETSQWGGITPIDGKIYWHLEEKGLTQDLEKYKVLFAMQKAFNTWQPYVPAQFEATSDPRQSQITLRFRHNGDRDLPERFDRGTLAYAYFPGGTSLGFHSDVYINDVFNWQEVHTARGRNLFKVVVHEIGHALGLGHSDVLHDIMYPTYQEDDNVIISSDTVEGMQTLYGEITPEEPEPTPEPEPEEPTPEPDSSVAETLGKAFIEVMTRTDWYRLRKSTLLRILTYLGTSLTDRSRKADMVEEILEKTQ